MWWAFEDEPAVWESLWRLLRDEELDAVRRARAFSQVVGMTVRAAKVQAAARKAGGNQESNEVTALLSLLSGRDWLG
jgi:hypothetical protein